MCLANFACYVICLSLSLLLPPSRLASWTCRNFTRSDLASKLVSFNFRQINEKPFCFVCGFSMLFLLFCVCERERVGEWGKERAGLPLRSCIYFNISNTDPIQKPTTATPMRTRSTWLSARFLSVSLSLSLSRSLSLSLYLSLGLFSCWLPSLSAASVSNKITITLQKLQNAEEATS